MLLKFEPRNEKRLYISIAKSNSSRIFVRIQKQGGGEEDAVNSSKQELDLSLSRSFVYDKSLLSFCRTSAGIVCCFLKWPLIKYSKIDFQNIRTTKFEFNPVGILTKEDIKKPLLKA